MLLINVKFQEEYKKLDALCKNILGSETGVTEYINQMDLTPFDDQLLVDSWNTDYKSLKHYRWVRNKLAHEVGALDEELCDEDDIIWLANFSKRLMERRDPFSIIFISKEERKREKAEKEKKREKPKAEKKKPKKKTSNAKNTEGKKGDGASLWTKFITGIKNLLKL